jgi:hypothetical protein
MVIANTLPTLISSNKVSLQSNQIYQKRILFFGSAAIIALSGLEKNFAAAIELFVVNGSVRCFFWLRWCLHFSKTGPETSASFVLVRMFYFLQASQPAATL